MIKKSDTVRQHVAAGEFKKALSIVKGFRLGISREDTGKMTQAYECMIHPHFFKQIQIDPEKSIETGIAILKSYYGTRNQDG